MDLVAQFFPQIMGQTSAAVDAAAGYRAGGTSDGVDRLVDSQDDVGDARVVAMMRQQIAAARAAHALDQTAAAQLGEQLLEIRQRNLLPLGDFGKAHRLAIAVPRQIDHCHDRIAALGAEPHGFALAIRARTGSAAGAGGRSPATGRSRSSSLTRTRSAATSSSSAVNGRAIGSGISPLMP